ncbi:P-type conjugative transfer protein TrbL [Pseudoduganella chitinolytica]|uniref:P-type conjugative transfer protein TrbL n=1 Tax=Pseudoduganella chitinolytica TaxID=34070 RepID=A0ABY8B7B8_9BURK|nr:P-type conjugative transfer protein TrbL [Pseudoduganella chitinolytica]WEF31827.1 P-type conjugative transfer protein TrbL [Pseudoduganella chitinolytica]
MGAVITGYATWLFWMLVTISMVWTFGMMALRKADIGEFFAEFVKFTITTGFFWWLLSNGPAMAVAIISSMQEIGARAAGSPIGIENLTPSSPISIGLNIVKKAFASLSWVHPIDNLAIVIVSTIILLCMCVAAANILITLVNAWVMAYAGIFILGFGGSRWTSDMAIGYFRSMLGVGMELMTITLLVGIATSLISGFYANLDGSSLYELLVVFCVCAVLALLIHKIPGRMAALAGGGSGAGVGVGTLMGGMAMAASTVATGGAAAVGAGLAGAASAAGGAQALMAAFSKASATEGAGSGGSGIGALTAAAGGGGGESGGGGSVGGSSLAAAMGDMDSASSSSAGHAGMGSSSSAGDSPTRASTGSSQRTGKSNAKGSAGKNSAPGEAKSGVAMMAAKVGKVVGGTAAGLAQGTWDVAKAKVSEVSESAMDRIGETTGGKIATAIKSREQTGRVTGTAQFDESSLSAGTKTGGMNSESESEIAEFVNRPASNDMGNNSGAKSNTSLTAASGKSVFD